MTEYSRRPGVKDSLLDRDTFGDPRESVGLNDGPSEELDKGEPGAFDSDVGLAACVGGA